MTSAAGSPTTTNSSVWTQFWPEILTVERQLLRTFLWPENTVLLDSHIKWERQEVIH